MTRRAEFLIAGMQKAGTTALHHFLSKHPEVFMPTRKELHFFDDEAIDWQATPYGDYNDYFAAAPDGKIVGEATPIYTFWPTAVQRISRYNPDMRLIVLLRHPVGRAFSHWRMETDRAVETLAFSEAIRGGRGRVAAAAVGLGQGLRSFSYVERGFYAIQIVRVYAFFPRRQVLFCTMEALRADFQSVFDQVTDFLRIGRMCIPEPYDVRLLPPGESSCRLLMREDARYLGELYAQDIVDTQALTGLDLAGYFREEHEFP